MSVSQYLRAADNMAAKISQRFSVCSFLPKTDEGLLRCHLLLSRHTTQHVVPLHCLSYQVRLSQFCYWYLHPHHQFSVSTAEYPCALLLRYNPNWSNFIVFLFLLCQSGLVCVQEFVPYWPAAWLNEGFSYKWRGGAGRDGSSKATTHFPVCRGLKRGLSEVVSSVHEDKGLWSTDHVWHHASVAATNIHHTFTNAATAAELYLQLRWFQPR